MYNLNFSEFWRVGVVVFTSGRGESLGYERSGFEVQVRPWVTIFFLFNGNTLNNRSKIF